MGMRGECVRGTRSPVVLHTFSGDVAVAGFQGPAQYAVAALFPVRAPSCFHGPAQ
jgi:hypothetical protein